MSDAPAPKSQRRRLVGVVKSDKMQKTVVVVVSRKVRDPLYHKFVARRASFKAHDEDGVAKTGDIVEIQEHRPISKDKRWKVIRVVRSGGLRGTAS
jgi:small subunit ribosomal protein S17